MAESHTLRDRKYLYNANKGVPPPPKGHRTGVRLKLRGKDITIPLRANPEQATPSPLPRLFGTAQRSWSPGQHCSSDNTEVTEGNFQDATGRDLLMDCLTPLSIFSGKSDIPKTHIYN